MRKLFFITYKFFWSIAATLLTCGMEGKAPGRKKIIMKRAKFSYEVKTYGSRWCLVITDTRTLADNCLSVTDDIAQVIEYIEYHGRMQAERLVVVFSDIDGVWNGYDAGKSKVIQLGCTSWSRAAEMYIQKALQPQHA